MSQEESDEEEAPKAAAPKRKADEEEEKPAKKAKTSEVDTSAAQGSTTIFIKNMPWSATEESIREFFSVAGEVVEVRIGECPAFSTLVSNPCPRAFLV